MFFKKFFLFISVMIFTNNEISCTIEPKSIISSNGTVVDPTLRGTVRHESNMDPEMELEVVAGVVKLVTKANNIINNQLVIELTKYLTESLKGSWFVIISKSDVYSTINKGDGSKYLRFSFENITFVVTQQLVIFFLRFH
jgi:hypothetical protein